ncbi:sensor histidine kinase [Pelagibacterium sp.]|uniref:sensor histidine kinase n=1 Tax=Pelagibacterium sp. TaxID=1967288 RepID=UPI003A9527CE
MARPPGSWHRLWLGLWGRRSLIEQFSLAGGAVMIVVMIVTGTVISNFVRSNALYHRAVATALFVDSSIVSHLGALRSGGDITDEAHVQLDSLFDTSAFADRVPYLDIWRADGTVLYSNSEGLIGEQFELPPGAVRAFNGMVVALETDLSALEHISRGFQRTYTEIYTPIHGADGEIIAVSEVHEASSDIGEALVAASIRSWVAVGLACLVFYLALFALVWRASQKLERQEKSLSTQLLQTQILADRNSALREQALSASRLLTEHNDHFLSTLGADLHDGPSQLISYAVLKVEMARRAKSVAALHSELGEIETNLTSALNDVRNIAHGLVLPQIEEGSLTDAIAHAVHIHKDRTGMTIDADLALGNARLDRSIRSINICVFRFVQEGLNNAYRHSASDNARVEATLDSKEMLDIRVISYGRKTMSGSAPSPGIGLEGLKARINALGGELHFSRLDEVSVLEMSLNLHEQAAHV